MKPLTLAIIAAKEAGSLLRKNFKKHHFVREKSPKDLVSEMDKRAEKIIISKIKKHFPTHSILSEESGLKKRDSEYEWVIDPLDGTTNYTIGSPFFNVSIALLKNNEPIVGVIYSPITDDLYYAQKNKGAFLNGKRIGVSNKTQLKKSLIVFCHSPKKKDISKIIKIFTKIKPLARDFNRMRAAALELALIAAGRIEAIMIVGTKLWDVAAGSLLVQEAGGKVTNFKNKPFTSKDNCFIASNKKLHNKLLRLIK